jgi:hypothetical protein
VIYISGGFMSFNFENLDGEIRELMLEELELDLRNKSLFK